MHISLNDFTDDLFFLSGGLHLVRSSKPLDGIKLMLFIIFRGLIFLKPQFFFLIFLKTCKCLKFHPLI